MEWSVLPFRFTHRYEIFWLERNGIHNISIVITKQQSFVPISLLQLNYYFVKITNFVELFYKLMWRVWMSGIIIELVYKWGNSVPSFLFFLFLFFKKNWTTFYMDFTVQLVSQFILQFYLSKIHNLTTFPNKLKGKA